MTAPKSPKGVKVKFKKEKKETKIEKLLGDNLLGTIISEIQKILDGE
jgi:hypothetical protein